MNENIFKTGQLININMLETLGNAIESENMNDIQAAWQTILNSVNNQPEEGKNNIQDEINTILAIQKIVASMKILPFV